ncbi:MAG: KEOPS complex kinase/ATPase Bud32 [Nanoarchaeota archaeon]
MNRTLVSTGAEAHIYKARIEDTWCAIKERSPKSYRLLTLDTHLRRSRTRKEGRILKKLPIPGPKLISCDEQSTITMQWIDGRQVKAILDEHPEIAEQIGTHLGALHDHNIIHGDLTTSNMIERQGTIHFIDFGLSHISTRVEDRAVDIHLFKRALESKHFAVKDEAYAAFLKGYRPRDRDAVLARLETVEGRGRYKQK